MQRDIDVLDEQVETFASRRGIEMDDATRTLLRDAMLWMADDISAALIETAAPDHDSERRWTAAERGAWKAMTDFAETERAWIDRVRADLGLPERDHKALEDSIKSVLNRRTT